MAGLNVANLRSPPVHVSEKEGDEARGPGALVDEIAQSGPHRAKILVGSDLGEQGGPERGHLKCGADALARDVGIRWIIRVYSLSAGSAPMLRRRSSACRKTPRFTSSMDSLVTFFRIPLLGARAPAPIAGSRSRPARESMRRLCAKIVPTRACSSAG
jgi:hypothetical protein